MIGEKIGSYEIVEQLGAGGMGAVYVAEHPQIGRRVAVKVLLPELSTNRDVVSRFFDEAVASNKVKHSGIVDVFDYGHTEAGQAYLVMELLEGESLAQRLRRAGKLAEAEAIRLCRQACSAVRAAHEVGIIHRDLKPDNLFVVPEPEITGGERVKILDFGIAKLTDKAANKTRTGSTMGSPEYMAPEQCRNAGGIDERADVYSMGCVLFHMVCGRPPFQGTGAGDIIGKQIYEAPPSPGLYAEISDGLESLIDRCLAKEPGERPADMSELIAALEALGADAVPSQPPEASDAGRLAATVVSSPGQAVAAATVGSGSKKRTLAIVAGVGALAAAGIAAAVIATGGSTSDGPAVDAASPLARGAEVDAAPIAEVEPAATEVAALADAAPAVVAADAAVKEAPKTSKTSKTSNASKASKTTRIARPTPDAGPPSKPKPDPFEVRPGEHKLYLRYKNVLGCASCPPYGFVLRGVRTPPPGTYEMIGKVARATARCPAGHTHRIFVVRALRRAGKVPGLHNGSGIIREKRKPALAE